MTTLLMLLAIEADDEMLPVSECASAAADATLLVDAGKTDDDGGGGGMPPTPPAPSGSPLSADILPKTSW